MKTKLCFVILCMSLLLVSCGPVEANRIYTVCRETEQEVYVYDADGNFYTWNGRYVKPCKVNDLQPQPRLTLKSLFDETLDYQLAYEMPSVYTATYTDALHYLGNVMLQDNGQYAITSVDWKSFEILITTNSYDLRALYTTDNYLRLYVISKAGEAMTPPYLKF